jgi:hypothetical protein
MNRYDCIAMLKSQVINHNYISLEQVLKGSDDPVSILYAILFSLGYEKVEHKINSIVVLTAKIRGYEDKYEYDITKAELHGENEEDLRKAFKVINSIENELSAAVIYPPEMRKRKISNILRQIAVDEEFFLNILKNWQ